ncbi:invasion associated locus B family protein [Candidatus Pelagibacter sp.]|nr:invasion associated locus B family protein [Candidatus Pelagibacter sp.]MDB4011283.1 invasion associated locus B family protein [Candidatus Pelagibacter sp.]
MKKIYKKRFLNKLILLTVLLLAPITSSAEINDKKWTKECAKDNKKSCLIAINSQVRIPDSDKKQTLATAYIQLGSTTERKMDLVDGEEKTYKLKEENKLVPVLTVRFPLNVDLKKQPLIQVDKKNILNIPFSHCNANEGCVTQISINDEVIKLFKSGKELTLAMGVYRAKDNMIINLPLKGFSKAYDSLLK